MAALCRRPCDSIGRQGGASRHPAVLPHGRLLRALLRGRHRRRRELQLTLTARDKAKSVPMCGVPYHAARDLPPAPAAQGLRVAICEQMEDPKLAKGIVRREVTRVLTPEPHSIRRLAPNRATGSRASLSSGSGKTIICGVALLDLSTGEFRATEFSGPAHGPSVADELGRLRPAELLYAAPALLGGVDLAGAGR